MKRILKLSKFRNLGLKNEDVLLLNNSLYKKNIGDLIILIGNNNSGKSNILDALFKLGNENNLSSEKDITYLSYEQEDKKPLVAIEIEDDDIITSYSLSCKEKKYFFKNKKEKKPLKKEIISELKFMLEICKKYKIEEGNIVEILKNIENNDIDISLEIQKIEEFLNFIYNKRTEYYNYRNYQIFFEECKTKYIVQSFLENKNDDFEKRANNYLNEKYGINLKPNIIKYIEKNISIEDMKTNYYSLKNNNFFNSIFKLINFDKEKIQQAYENFNKYSNSSILTNIENEINEKMSIINNQFNKLYYSDNDAYIFSIKLESEKILFGLTRGKNKVATMLESQSTGFKWFFNFYFNFISNNPLSVGDIIIMDEPATHLHPAGQRELRKFIKEFSKVNGITFILSTHSPFFIDVDNYDELRIVSSKNNISSIDNSFTAVNLNDPDTLLPIKNSLTIQQNVLYSVETEIIWVEGITDYNYLTMFKKLLNYEDISFIPFNGVGKNDEQQLQIIEKLNNIKFYKKNILVDGDQAGKQMIKNCKNTCFDKIISILDLNLNPKDKKIIEIEDLFSEDDKNKFLCLNKNSPRHIYKSSIISSNMKNSLTIKDFSEETIDNFKKLFHKLLDNGIEK